MRERERLREEEKKRGIKIYLRIGEKEEKMEKWRTKHRNIARELKNMI
jgi:hypothetical protein